MSRRRAQPCGFDASVLATGRQCSPQALDQPLTTAVTPTLGSRVHGAPSIEGGVGGDQRISSTAAQTPLARAVAGQALFEARSTPLRRMVRPRVVDPWLPSAMMKRQAAGPALPDVLISVGEAALAKLVRSLRQLLDPLTKAAHVQLGSRLGQLLDPLAKAPHVPLSWDLGQLLDAADASDGLADTSGFVCRLRAHERPPSVVGCSIYRRTIS
jgi:hypothetical protein